MAKMYLPYCAPCNCEEDPADPQCSFTDGFVEHDTRYTDTGDVFGDIDLVTGTISASGTGSYTLRLVASSFPHISAETHTIFDTGSTASGVTIRRYDSDERIVLVRNWSTSNGYELRRGGSVLAAFNSAGPDPDDAATVKLRLEQDAGSGDWLALCYVDGVLLHTELDIDFALPAVVHAGLFADGAGTFDFLSVSPCPPPPCEISTPMCAQIPNPLFWVLTLGGTGNDNITGPMTPEEVCSDDCDLLNQEFVLMNLTRTRGIYVDGSIYHGTVNARWTEPVDQCKWASILPSGVGTKLPLFHETYAEAPNTTDSVIMPPNRSDGSRAFPLLAFEIMDPDSLGANACSINPQVTAASYSVQFTGPDTSSVSDNRSADPAWQLEWDHVNNIWTLLARIHRSFNTDFNPGSGYGTGFVANAWYYAEPGPGHDNLTDDLVFTLSESHQGCNFPETVTLQPNGHMTDKWRKWAEKAECGTTCPLLDPFKNYMITGIMDGLGASGEFCGHLEPQYDEETYEWSFDGFGFFEYWQECSESDLFSGFGLEIKCIEAGEGGEVQWTAIIKGREGRPDSYIPVDFQFAIDGTLLSAMIDGVMDSLCGPGQAISMTINECDETHNGHPLADCYCGDSLLCCITSLQTQGEIRPTFPGGCGEGCTTSFGTLDYSLGDELCASAGQNFSDFMFGFDPAKPYFRGSIPISDIASQSLVLYCHDGTMRLYAIDGNNCPSPFQPSWEPGMGWDCNTLSGTVNMQWPTDNCCGGGGGAFLVHIG